MFKTQVEPHVGGGGGGGQVVSLQCFEPFDGVSMVLRVQLPWQLICSDAVNLSNPNSD